MLHFAAAYRLVILFCVDWERETASSLLLFPRDSDAMLVVTRYTHPHGNGPVARSFAVFFLLGTPGSIMAYRSRSLKQRAAALNEL